MGLTGLRYKRHFCEMDQPQPAMALQLLGELGIMYTIA